MRMAIGEGTSPTTAKARRRRRGTEVGAATGRRKELDGGGGCRP